MLERAYVLLSLQDGISQRKAKELIDRGRVSIDGKKLKIAREMISASSTLTVQKISKPKELFKSDVLLALDKPAFANSGELERDSWVLLNRLDRGTSGVILLTKEGCALQKKAILEFRSLRVYKEYLALVDSKNASKLKPGSTMTFNAPLKVHKAGYIRTSISREKDAKKALTEVQVLEVSKSRALLRVVIKTGVSHQIRAHLAHGGLAILGDEIYGGKSFWRMMLHSRKIAFLDYEFESEIPKEFNLENQK